jgi:hypothetical protein
VLGWEPGSLRHLQVYTLPKKPLEDYSSLWEVGWSWNVIKLIIIVLLFGLCVF